MNTYVAVILCAALLVVCACTKPEPPQKMDKTPEPEAAKEVAPGKGETPTETPVEEPAPEEPVVKETPVPMPEPGPSPVFEKHVYYTINMANESQLTKAREKCAAAKAAGYTHIVLDDTKFQKLDIMKVYEDESGEHPFPRNEENLKALATFRGAMAGCRFAESFMTLKEIS